MSELCQSEGHQGQNLTHLGLNQTEPDSSQYPLPQNADLLTPRVPQAVPVLPLPYPEGWTQVTSTIRDLCYHFRAIVKYFGIALSFSSPLRPTNSVLPRGTSNLHAVPESTGHGEGTDIYHTVLWWLVYPCLSSWLFSLRAQHRL